MFNFVAPYCLGPRSVLKDVACSSLGALCCILSSSFQGTVFGLGAGFSIMKNNGTLVLLSLVISLRGFPKVKFVLKRMVSSLDCNSLVPNKLK